MRCPPHPRVGGYADRGRSGATVGFWVTNGPVRASLLVGSTLFIGGDFTYEGPATGHAVALDPASGAARTPFPRIGGTVTAIVSDGSGGWFVGGTLAAWPSVTWRTIAATAASTHPSRPVPGPTQPCRGS